MLVECAVRNLSMEGLCNRNFKSSDRLFFYMGERSLEESVLYCNGLLKHAFKVLLKTRWHWRRVWLAIDYNDVEYGGVDPLMVHDAMMMRGIQYQHVKVLRYATIAIVARGFKFTLAVMPVSTKDRAENVVERLLDLVPPELKIRGVLMDKGFYNANVFKTMDDMEVDYVVPAKKFPEMKLTYRIAEVTEKWYWKYTMNLGKPNEHMTTVFLEEKGMDDYIGMVTNKNMTGMDASMLFQSYRLRWNIENSYKESDYYKIKTNTRNHAYRILIYTIRHLLVDLLILAKRINQTTITHDEMKQILELLLTMKHQSQRLTKKLIVIT